MSKRMTTHLAMLLLLTLLCALVVSCTPAAPAQETPQSRIPGYYAAGQHLSGGKQMEGVNLRSLGVGLHSGETWLSLSFVTGSMREGEQEAPLNDTPAYIIESLPGPARLKVTVLADYLDYGGNSVQPAGLFYALTQVSRQEGEITLYFQFTGKIAFKTEEEKGALVLRILPDEPDEQEYYYAAMEMSEETHGAAQEDNMTPVICDDGGMLYISAPYENIEKADAQVLSLNERLQAQGANARADMIEHTGNYAPAQSALISRSELARLGALQEPDGTVLSAEPWAVDARFLSWMPGGASALCARPVSREADGATITYEELWAYNADGTRYRFLESEISYALRAGFSPDGRYLAFIERKEYKQLLYLYDTKTQTLDFLSAEGMGDFTVGFDWSDQGLLYAMSGDDDVRLLVCDPTMEASSESRIAPVEDQPGSLGSVFCAGDMIYFNDGENAAVMQVELNGAVRERYTDGEAVSVSPDGTHMLLVRREEEGSRLILRNIQSGEERLLSQGLPYRASSWSLDSQTLHFLMQNDDEDYPGVLFEATVGGEEARKLGLLASDSIYTGLTAQEIVLVSYYGAEQTDQWEPITYRLPLTSAAQ